MPRNADEGEQVLYNDPLMIYHPTTRKTGSALKLEPRINQKHGERFNCFFLEMARQRDVEDERGHAVFDWENKVTVKLDFNDICELLLVLEDRVSQAGRDGKGLFHQRSQSNTIITLQRRGPGEGYEMGLSRKKGEQKPQQVRIALTEAEALGLRCLFQTGLFLITFHSQMNNRRAVQERSFATSDMAED